MGLYQKLFYGVLAVMMFAGCQQKKTKVTKKVTGVQYAMQPTTYMHAKLSDAYKKTKKNQIQNFIHQKFGQSLDNICLLIAKDGQIIYEQYAGYANKEEDIRNGKEVPLHIASVSKVLTATAVLKLIDANKLSLDQKLVSLFPKFPYQKVTIRTLLNHRSGMRKYNYFCDHDSIWGRTKTLTNRDLLKVMETKNIPLEYEPDTHFSYNNTNYALLALVIEKVTGKKYKDAMAEIIFEPLGMNHTYVFDENSNKDLATPSYKYNYVKYGFDFLDAVYGDKNIYSTPRDLLKFDLARNAPNFLSPKLTKEVFKGYSYESRGEKNYGLGIRLFEFKDGKKLFYHNGWWHGNTSSYIAMRKENAVIIALSNKYTTKTYQFKQLSALFGDYPYSLTDQTEGNAN